MGSMEMHSYYEEGTCAWLLVFKCSQCTFNMLFPLVFDTTDVTRADKGRAVKRARPIKKV